MIETYSLIILFWIPVLIVLFKKYFWDLYFWQIKEYRWDRFWTHIRWDQSEPNRSYYSVGIKFILFSLTTLIIKVPQIALLAMIASYVIWVFESFEYISEIKTNLIRPSIKSLRNILIIFYLFIISTLIPLLITLPFSLLDRSSNFIGFFSQSFNEAQDFIYPDIFILIGFLTLFGLFMDLATPFFVTTGVFITWPISFLKRKLVIYRARKKIDLIRDKITLVAITGSQGKTTTKEILYEILKTKYKVVKTPENYNTDFGIASAILSGIKKNTEIFIAEMGAYRKGEIKGIVKNFTPDISIITDIDTQHIGIFGGRRQLKEAKAEAVKYMRTNGQAILNGDSEACRDIAKDLENFVTLVSSEMKNIKELKKLESPKKEYIISEKPKFDSNNISFSIKDNNSLTDVNLKGFGQHLVSNVLLAITAASKLGMSFEAAARALENSKIQLPRLTQETGDNNTIILNDSYSSSFKGFISAINYMNNIKFSGKRIVITKGIYELGREKRAIYKELASQTKNDFDILITSDTALSQAFTYNNTSLEIIKVSNFSEMIYQFREKASEGDIVLLEGRLNPKVIEVIISDQA